MFWFIPAWYANNDWKENEQPWYSPRRQSEVDDTVKQIQLFDRKSDIEQMTILLSHAPNYRHFLHRQGLLHSRYWSCFDAIQEITVKRPAILSFHDLSWPEGMEFIYSPFAVVAMLDGKKYAQIEFGEDGNMFQLDMYRDDRLVRRNLYDDRGFLSLTCVYRDGQMAYEQYLNEAGIWKICRYADGHVDVNPKEDHYLLKYNNRKETRTYLHSSYENMETLIREVLSAYVQHISANDIFCIAMHPLHSALLASVLKKRNKIASFFNKRCNLLEDFSSLTLASSCERLIVNSRDVITQAGLTAVHGGIIATVITPFDSRMDFGKSLQMKEQNILISADRLEDVAFEQLVISVMPYLEQNESARINLFTRSAYYGVEDHLLEKVREILAKHGFDPEVARKADGKQAENLLDEQKPVLFTVRKCVDELSVNKCLQEQRIVVDLEDETDLFLQISALSMGLPQIVRSGSEYVIDGGNGRILRDISKIGDVLSYYLDTLKHWNEANIASYELGRKYTSENLVTQWREVIDSVSHN